MRKQMKAILHHDRVEMAKQQAIDNEHKKKQREESKISKQQQKRERKERARMGNEEAGGVRLREMRKKEEGLWTRLTCSKEEADREAPEGARGRRHWASRGGEHRIGEQEQRRWHCAARPGDGFGRPWPAEGPPGG